MKKPALLAAYMAAASTSAISSSYSPSSSKIQFSREDCDSRKNGENSTSQISSTSDKFAPRFDGLRFIETLVTAHR